MWIELLPMRIYLDAPPKDVQVIRHDTPLTPADGMLLLVGADIEVTRTEWEAWGVGRDMQLRKAQTPPSLTAMGMCSNAYQRAMWEIRREQLDAYMSPHRAKQ